MLSAMVVISVLLVAILIPVTKFATKPGHGTAGEPMGTPALLPTASLSSSPSSRLHRPSPMSTPVLPTPASATSTEAFLISRTNSFYASLAFHNATQMMTLLAPYTSACSGPSHLSDSALGGVDPTSAESVQRLGAAQVLQLALFQNQTQYLSAAIAMVQLDVAIRIRQFRLWAVSSAAIADNGPDGDVNQRSERGDIAWEAWLLAQAGAYWTAEPGMAAVGSTQQLVEQFTTDYVEALCNQTTWTTTGYNKEVAQGLHPAAVMGIYGQTAFQRLWPNTTRGFFSFWNGMLLGQKGSYEPDNSPGYASFNIGMVFSMALYMNRVNRSAANASDPNAYLSDSLDLPRLMDDASAEMMPNGNAVNYNRGLPHWTTLSGYGSAYYAYNGPATNAPAILYMSYIMYGNPKHLYTARKIERFLIATSQIPSNLLIASEVWPSNIKQFNVVGVEPPPIVSELTYMRVSPNCTQELLLCRGVAQSDTFLIPDKMVLRAGSVPGSDNSAYALLSVSGAGMHANMDQRMTLENTLYNGSYITARPGTTIGDPYGVSQVNLCNCILIAPSTFTNNSLSYPLINDVDTFYSDMQLNFANNNYLLQSASVAQLDGGDAYGSLYFSQYEYPGVSAGRQVVLTAAGIIVVVDTVYNSGLTNSAFNGGLTYRLWPHVTASGSNWALQGPLTAYSNTGPLPPTTNTSTLFWIQPAVGRVIGLQSEPMTDFGYGHISPHLTPPHPTCMSSCATTARTAESESHIPLHCCLCLPRYGYAGQTVSTLYAYDAVSGEGQSNTPHVFVSVLYPLPDPSEAATIAASISIVTNTTDGSTSISIPGQPLVSVPYLNVVPPATGSLLVWLSAGSLPSTSYGAPLHSWADSSGNNYTFTPLNSSALTTVSGTAMNGLPAVLFNGSQAMVGPSVFPVGVDYTITALVLFPTNMATRHSIVGSLSGAQHVLGGVVTASGGHLADIHNTVTATSTTLPTVTLNVPLLITFTWQQAVGVGNLYLNGTLIANITASPTNTVSDPSMVLGWFNDPPTQGYGYMTGYVSELYIFNYSLPTSNRTALEHSIRQSYGILGAPALLKNVTSSLVLWLSAGSLPSTSYGAPLHSWADSSGNNYTFTPLNSSALTTVSGTAMNGLPAVLFNGSQAMVGPSVFPVGVDYTITALVLFPTNMATRHSIVGSLSGAQHVLGGVVTASGGHLADIHNTVTATSTTLPTVTLNVPLLITFTWQQAVGVGNLYLNGTLIANITASPTNTVSDPSMVLGWFNDPPTQGYGYMTGYVSELYIFNYSLPTSNRTALEHSIRQSYGILGAPALLKNVTSSLVLWLSAGSLPSTSYGAPLHSWADSSGNNYTFTPLNSSALTTVSGTAMNGLPAVLFNGSQAMVGPSVFPVGVDYTITALVLFPTNMATRHSIVGSLSGAQHVLGGVVTASGGHLADIHNTVTATSTTLPTVTLNVPLLITFTWQQAVGVGNLYLNGTLIANITASPTNTVSDPSMVLGWFNDPPTQGYGYMTGYVSELYIFNYSLPTSNRTALEHSIRQSYGILGAPALLKNVTSSLVLWLSAGSLPSTSYGAPLHSWADSSGNNYTFTPLNSSALTTVSGTAMNGLPAVLFNGSQAMVGPSVFPVGVDYTITALVLFPTNMATRHSIVGSLSGAQHVLGGVVTASGGHLADIHNTVTATSTTLPTVTLNVPLLITFTWQQAVGVGNLYLNGTLIANITASPTNTVSDPSMVLGWFNDPPTQGYGYMTGYVSELYIFNYSLPTSNRTALEHSIRQSYGILGAPALLKNVTSSLVLWLSAGSLPSTSYGAPLHSWADSSGNNYTFTPLNSSALTTVSGTAMNGLPAVLFNGSQAMVGPSVFPVGVDYTITALVLFPTNMATRHSIVGSLSGAQHVLGGVVTASGGHLADIHNTVTATSTTLPTVTLNVPLLITFTWQQAVGVGNLYLNGTLIANITASPTNTVSDPSMVLGWFNDPPTQGYGYMTGYVSELYIFNYSLPTSNRTALEHSIRQSYGILGAPALLKNVTSSLVLWLSAGSLPSTSYGAPLHSWADSSGNNYTFTPLNSSALTTVSGTAMNGLPAVLFNGSQAMVGPSVFPVGVDYTITALVLFPTNMATRHSIVGSLSGAQHVLGGVVTASGGHLADIHNTVTATSTTLPTVTLNVPLLITFTWQQAVGVGNLYLNGTLIANITASPTNTVSDPSMVLGWFNDPPTQGYGYMTGYVSELYIFNYSLPTSNRTALEHSIRQSYGILGAPALLKNVTSSLVLWLSAGSLPSTSYGAPLHSWADSSGNNYTFTPLNSSALTTVSGTAMNGLPAVLFNGSQAMVGPSVFPVGVDYTITALVLFPTNMATRHSIVGSLSGAQHVLGGVVTASGGHLADIHNTVTATSTTLPTVTLNVPLLITFTWQQAVGVGNLYLNGTLIANITASPTNTVSDPSMVLGWFNDPPTQGYGYMTGYVSELYIFNYSLPTSNRTALEHSIRQSYGILGAPALLKNVTLL